MNTTLAQLLITEFQQASTPKSLVPRQVTIPQVPNKIIALIGMRRVGKTYLCWQLIDELLAQGINKRNCLYLNFEDDRVLPLDSKGLSLLLESFYEYAPENHQSKCHIFLDEIQNVEGWARVLRRFSDTRDIQFYITGSSAKLLSKEISTELRGRSLSVEVWPFSFNEYATSQKKAITNQPKSPREISEATNIFKRYLHTGGFPELATSPPEHHHQILQEYIDVVILRDIVERYKVTNISLLRYLIKTLLSNLSTPLAINKLFNDLKSQGLKVSKDSLYNYMTYIEDAFLAFTVPLYTPSLRRQHSNPKKIYAVDPAVQSLFKLHKDINEGALFENIIYLELRRQGGQIHYYLTEEGYEVDFVIKTPSGELQLYQVCLDTTEQKTLAREQRALESAEKELGIKGKIISQSTFIQQQ